MNITRAQICLGLASGLVSLTLLPLSLLLSSLSISLPATLSPFCPFVSAFLPAA